MALFKPADSVYIRVRDMESAVAWYRDKFGFREVPAESDDADGSRWLALGKDEPPIVLGPPDDNVYPTPIFWANNVVKCRDKLSSLGINAGPVQQDRQGTHFFEFRDIEGNVIEVCEEP